VYAENQQRKSMLSGVEQSHVDVADKDITKKCGS
jgi:hypothetical protein